MEPHGTISAQTWFSAKEVCAKLGMDVRLFRDYVERGLFPRGIKRGKRQRIWSAADIAAMVWLEANRHRLKSVKPIVTTGQSETKRDKTAH